LVETSTKTFRAVQVAQDAAGTPPMTPLSFTSLKFLSATKYQFAASKEGSSHLRLVQPSRAHDSRLQLFSLLELSELPKY
jgi:hypothetical protein